jgi:hypothetical protein
MQSRRRSAETQRSFKAEAQLALGNRLTWAVRHGFLCHVSGSRKIGRPHRFCGCRGYAGTLFCRYGSGFVCAYNYRPETSAAEAAIFFETQKQTRHMTTFQVLVLEARKKHCFTYSLCGEYCTSLANSVSHGVVEVVEVIEEMLQSPRAVAVGETIRVAERRHTTDK